jgi:hypothetical protein
MYLEINSMKWFLKKSLYKRLKTSIMGGNDERSNIPWK